MGDYLAKRFPDAGRLVFSQISSGSAIPLAAVLLLVLPDDQSTAFRHGLEFVKATIAYKNKVNSSTSVPQPLKLDVEMEMKRKKIVRSFSIARNIYSGGLGSGLQPIKEYELEARAEFPDV
ncbi:hypothetical protein ACE6H2_020728 [Prunus campanulata]